MSIKLMFKVCSVAVLFLLVFAALGPEKWVPRSGLGWRFDHFFGYFALTLMFSFGWRACRLLRRIAMPIFTLH
jgi:hypothetical protein